MYGKENLLTNAILVMFFQTINKAAANSIKTIYRFLHMVVTTHIVLSIGLQICEKDYKKNNCDICDYYYFFLVIPETGLFVAPFVNEWSNWDRLTRLLIERR